MHPGLRRTPMSVAATIVGYMSAGARSISLDSARRIALAAQGFGGAVPARVGRRQLGGVIDRLGLLQIDSVNVFERSHYLPVFARLGAYDRADLDRLTMTGGVDTVEFLAHEAAFIRTDAWPLFGWRREQYRERYGHVLEADDGRLAGWLLDQLAANGPLKASEIEHERNARTGPWWGWSEVKRTLETLFRFGDVVVAGRHRFERRYALPDQVLPAPTLGAQVPRADAVRELVRRSLTALGVGTLGDIADYYRLRNAPAAAALRELEESGEAQPVVVRGWDRAGRPLPAWIATGARTPRRMQASALLSPFDPIVWYRDRALRLFDLDYRIEIYTPAPRRTYGYYVLPVLQDDRIVARVDLKSDRKAGVLLVQAAWQQPAADKDTPERLAALLRDAAQWQGLSAIEVRDRGTLAMPLAAALA
jgi:uncharacterized protein YcaQ